MNSSNNEFLNRKKKRAIKFKDIEKSENKSNKYKEVSLDESKSNKNKATHVHTNKKKFNSKNNGKKSANMKTEIIGKVENVETLLQKAKILYQTRSKPYDLDQIDKKDRDKKWTSDILKSGTFEDKLSALVLYIKKNPSLCLKYVDMIIKMAKTKNRRKAESCSITLKDIFLETFLTNTKLKSFYSKYSEILNSKDSLTISDDELVKSFIDDFIHKKYLELIEAIESQMMNDPLKAIKKKYMNILLEMISKRPEREEKILDVIINKLGDPEVEVSNYAMKTLKSLQEAHPKMSVVIFKNVQNFMSKQSQEHNNAKFYSLVYLTQMNVIPSSEFMEISLNFFFDLFNLYSNNSSEHSEKYLSLIVKRINIICHAGKNLDSNVKNLINEKMSVLFRLSHSKSVKLRVEVLKLIFSISQENNKNDDKNDNFNYLNRYYKSLYELLLQKDILFSKYLREFLKLLLQSLIYDTNLTRVAAIVKRLLQMSLSAEPPFTTCALIILSQVIRNKHKLWKMLENPINKISEYDASKRDPEYSNADQSILTELAILSKHYHPTVQKFTKFILENYNKDTISYEGDPLIDFSLVNFLEKFMLKNPKVQKEKKGNKKMTEEEELQKFLGEEDGNANANHKDLNEDTPLGEFDLDFISKFNKVESKISSSKNYVKRQKKIQKKNTSNNELEEQDIEEFADQVMDQEYERLDKQVDDDADEFDDEDIEEEEEDVYSEENYQSDQE
jgi:ribosome biogenesis protein MAK21